MFRLYTALDIGFYRKMINPHSWKYHMARLALVASLVILMGGWFGHAMLVGVLFLLAYLAWQLYNSVRLHQWLRAWDEDPPESLGIWSEIFDRISALQQLNKKRQRQYQSVIDDFQGMADAFPDATMVLDSNDVITWFNGSAVQLLGLKDPADRDQTVTNLLREPAFAVWLAVQDKVQNKLEMRCPADNNTILQVNTVRFRQEQRLLILRDITDIQNLEQVRRDFVANVSHELRTPLTVLLGYLEMLQDEKEKPEPAAIRRMFKQAQQMHALLEDLLELSRLQDEINHDDAVDINVPALLQQLKEQAEELSRNAHHFQFRIQPCLHLRGVESDLVSAFGNLLTNAVRYTSAGGHIEVKWRETDEGLVLSVKDDGIGIPHRDIPRLTERFYRVSSDRSRETGGTGLGLAIVKHVLNAHQARLEIISETGEGSEFRCVFPCHRKVLGNT